MIRGMTGDAIFIMAVFFENLAALSLLERFKAIVMPEAFSPVMALYHTKILPLLVPLAQLIKDETPAWLSDAALIASVLFFHFFIGQTRQAMAPFEGEGEARDRAEALIDWLLPIAACAIAAIATGPLLLPLLTLPAALALSALRLSGSRPRFKVPSGYYANLLGLGLAPILVLTLGL
jgi:hypothetical protein